MEQLIAETVAKLGITPSRPQLAALSCHADLLLEANATQNLTRIVEPEAVALLHIADSLTALPYLAAAPSGPFADLGSGGGFPGIPLAIMSGRPVTLVESRGGKAAFLTRVIETLGLDGDVRSVRAEELAADEPGAFAATTARALAALPALVELASPLLRHGGLLIAMKGDPERTEVEAAKRVAGMTGMAMRRVEPLCLPEADAKRTIVVLERTGPSKVRLPRRPGMAQRHPLA